jgi:ATP-dependent helicase/nuclease subunit A
MPLTEQQQRAVDSIEHNVLVSAGAGCGKTMVLVERFLQILRAHGDARITDVIAVTFTRKAAEEMRARLKARVKSIADAAEGDEATRWGALLADVDHARIGTIHSLCESILKSHPAEAAVDPQFEILDDLSRAALINESVEEVLQYAIADNSGRFTTLLDYPIESIRNWILPQLMAAPQYLESRQRYAAATQEQLRADAGAIIKKVQLRLIRDAAAGTELKRCHEFLANNPWHDPENSLEKKRILAVQLIDAVMSAAARVDLDGWLLAVQDLASFESLGTSGGKLGKPMRDVIAAARKHARDLLSIYPAGFNDADDIAFQIVESLIELCDRAIGAYIQRKRKQKGLDYNDLIDRTAKLLTSHAGARTQLSQHLRAILVDEFQDTNRTQARLIASLNGERSRLFLIGDDKQSIYKFQGADVGTFNEWKETLKSGSETLPDGGLLLDLNQSFRSHPTLVEFVNTLFKLLFDSSGAEEDAHKARHQSLAPSRTDAGDPARVDVVLIEKEEVDERRDVEAARILEGRSIARWIQQHIDNQTTIFDKEAGGDRPIQYGDFAVLVQANSNFSFVEAALAEAKIPYVTLAGSGFLERQEVFDIENLLRFLACPSDNHALLAVLRSPFFGVPDDIIHRLVAGTRSSLWRNMYKSRNEPEFASLLRPMAVLKELLDASFVLPLGELVQLIVQRTSYDVIISALPNGKQRSRNVWKLVTMAAEHNHMAPIDFVCALDTMRELSSSNQSDAPLSTENAVKLMTIHKSKGLEFPAVILPALSRKIHRFSPKLLLHKDFGIAFDTSRSKDDEKPCFYKTASYLHKQMEAAEKKRLLYVAMTRARDYLGIFVERNVTAQESFRSWIRDVLKIDADDGPRESGIYTLQNTAQYQMSVVLEDDIRDFVAATARRLTELRDESAAEMDFTLVEPLPGAHTELPDPVIAWQQLTRVTPGGDDVAIHQTVIGNFFHAVMQRLTSDLQRPSKELLSSLSLSREIKVFHQQFQDELIAQAGKLIEIFFESELYMLLLNAKTRLHEAPYTVLADENPEDKRPDLIIEDHAGNWHIIDFKTDAVDPAALSSKVREHREQIARYVEDLSRLTGVRAQASLYFAQIGKLEKVEYPLTVQTPGGQLKLVLPH